VNSKELAIKGTTTSSPGATSAENARAAVCTLEQQQKKQQQNKQQQTRHRIPATHTHTHTQEMSVNRRPWYNSYASEGSTHPLGQGTDGFFLSQITHLFVQPSVGQLCELQMTTLFSSI
jgi:hypothetical protein